LYFVNTGNFRSRVHGRADQVPDSEIATQSNYFLIRGQVKLDRAVTRMEALVYRPGVNQAVQVLWQREL
jgi:type II secretory pathway component PulK